MKNQKIKLITTKIKPKIRKLRKGYKFYNGYEVCDNHWPPNVLKKLNDIKEEKKILLLDCFENVQRAICNERTGKKCVATDLNQKHVSYFLEFDGDDRHCWVTTCTNYINPELLDKPLISVNTKK